MRLMLRSLLAAVATTVISVSAVAAYPERPVVLVNPYAAGGPADVVARSLARALEKRLGQPVVVENKPGGGASIGTGFVARARPDGYTLLLGTSAGHVVTPLMQKTVYDGVKGFAFCSVVAVQPIMLVVNPSRGIRSVPELIARAKAAPGKLSYGSAGVGGATHLGAELFQQAAGVQLNHIPYAGASPAINDVVGGQTDLAMLNLSASLPFIRQGRLLALAYASDKRSPLLPDVPTLAEAGIKDMVVYSWQGFAVPKGTPPAVVQQLTQALQTALRDPQTEKTLQGLGFEVVANTPQQFSAFQQAEVKRWKEVIQKADIQLE